VGGDRPFAGRHRDDAQSRRIAGRAASMVRGTRPRDLLATQRHTKKVARIARDPRGSFLVESGKHWAELRGVHLSGQIEPVEEEAVKALIDAALTAKYVGFRPESRIALTVAMRRGLCELLDTADQDTAVKAVILTGTDPAFTAGVDFKEMDPAFDPTQRRFAVNPGRALRAMRTAVICAVNGACLSGGLEIALSASFIVASVRAGFADTHARRDVTAARGLSALLPRAVGTRMAREMSITGNPSTPRNRCGSGS
jgi:Enoyl-CoA hydratase/isomerase